jgi:DNA end-binding protein Ku
MTPAVHWVLRDDSPQCKWGNRSHVARPVWSGTISFGLVNVPVKAFTAVRDHDVHFNQLEKRSGARIRNKKVSDKTGREVQGDDIELGFEVRKGRYVTFDKKELEELKPESTKAVEVTDFVDLEAVDPIFYERTYWLGPADDTGKQAYGLLVAAMEDKEKVAIGTVVMRNKQYLAAIRPLDGALAMSTMRFADEVVPRSDVDGVPNRRTKPEPKALKLATQIIESLAAEWKPEQYHDNYAEELRARIERKDEGKDIAEEAEAPARGAEILDLMEALEQSVSAAKGRRRSGGGPDKASKPEAKESKRASTKRSARKSA